MGAATEGAPPRLRLGLLLVGIAVLAIQLRGPLVAIAPVVADAERGWGVGTSALGLLTTIPLLCFGLATPLAPLGARRIGLERTVEVCLVGILAGTLLRSVGGFGAAVAGAVLLGLAIAVGNVLVPALIRRDVPAGRRGSVTAVYTVALNVGTMLTTLGTAPLAALIGWRAAIAGWSLAGVVAIALWLLLLRNGPDRHGAGPPADGPAATRPGLIAWLLGVTFSAQAFSYYGITSWLPSLLADERGLGAGAAGVASAVFQAAAIGGAVGVPVLALRLPPRTVLAVVGVLWVSLPLGLLLVPEWFVPLSVLGGIAQGAGFTAIMTLVAGLGSDHRRTAALSASVQSIGYLLAAAAPPLLGGLRAATGGWSVPMAVVLGATLAFLACGVLAATLAGRRPAASGEGLRR